MICVERTKKLCKVEGKGIEVIADTALAVATIAASFSQTMNAPIDETIGLVLKCVEEGVRRSAADFEKKNNNVENN